MTFFISAMTPLQSSKPDAHVPRKQEPKKHVALAFWNAQTARNLLLTRYPCSKGPYPKGKAGYAPWRDTNHNGIACDR